MRLRRLVQVALNVSEYVPRLETRKHEPPLTGVEARSLEYKYIQARCTLKTQVRIKTIAGSDQGERVETLSDNGGEIADRYRPSQLVPEVSAQIVPMTTLVLRESAQKLP